MKTKSMLLALLLSTSITAFSVPNEAFAWVGKIEGNASVDKEASFKVHYRWFADGKRRGEITYNVGNTKCQGVIKVDEHPAFTNVEGEETINCIFNEKAKYAAEATLQLFDGDVAKEASPTSIGEVNVE